MWVAVVKRLAPGALEPLSNLVNVPIASSPDVSGAFPFWYTFNIPVEISRASSGTFSR